MSESPSKSEEAMSKEEIMRAEKEEEAKLKAKYPAVRPGPQLLQKRMQKGVSAKIVANLYRSRDSNLSVYLSESPSYAVWRVC